MLLAEPGCTHPLCLKKQTDPSTVIPTTWYPAGPPVTFLPLPVVDESRPWGNSNCSECTGTCNAHYLKPTELMQSTVNKFASSPSTVIQDFSTKLNGVTPSEEQVLEIARQTLLPVSEVNIWLAHIQEVSDNRK